MTTMSTLYGPNGFVRDLTGDDLLWAVRMLVGEAGSDPARATEWAAILWTMANRWASCRFRCPKTYTEFIRTFSRPINPKWWPDQPTGMNPAIDHPLDWFVSRAPAAVATAYQFLSGKLPNGFPGWTDFAAPGVGSAGHARVTTSGLGSDSNWFYVEPFATNWTTRTVYFGGTSWGVSPRTAGLSLAAGIVIAVVGIGWWMRRRRARSGRAWRAGRAL